MRWSGTAKRSALDIAVRTFVKGALGCECPDEVFDTINYEKVKDGLIILIGGRLMVHLVPTSSRREAMDIKEILALLSEGKQERDRRGFNRFRLVFIGDSECLAKEAFERFDNDGRVHIHVVDGADLPKALKAKLGIH